jgi:rare lipoprotein A (peptidoglycan hydrolase)
MLGTDVRRPRVVASTALIALLALVAVPGQAGSRVPNPESQVNPDLFKRVEVAALVRGTVMMIPPLDPGARSAGTLDQSSRLYEPTQQTEPTPAPVRAAQPAPKAGSISKNPWRWDGNVSWYGPTFYGKRTACGLAMTQELLGVAHRTLPCGTLITFRNPANGRTLTLPVVDRGPYVYGRQWDLTGGACLALGHCYTGSFQWKYAKG